MFFRVVTVPVRVPESIRRYPKRRAEGGPVLKRIANEVLEPRNPRLAGPEGKGFSLRRRGGGGVTGAQGTPAYTCRRNSASLTKSYIFPHSFFFFVSKFLITLSRYRKPFPRDTIGVIFSGFTRKC